MKQRTTSVEPSYWAKYRYYFFGWIVALLAFGLAAWSVYDHALKDWELGLLIAVQDWPLRLREVFVAVTMLGSIWAAAVLVMGTFVFRLYQLAWRLALSVLSVYGLTVLIKQFLERPQPHLLDATVQARMVEIGPSFPSTHAALAAVLSLTFLMYAPARWRWPITFLWVGLVAVSRLYLGVNAPLDVLAGLALGAGVFCFWHILPKIIKRFLRVKA